MRAALPSVAKEEGIESALEPPAVIAAAIGETVADAVAVDGAENGVIARTTAPENTNQSRRFKSPLLKNFRSESSGRSIRPADAPPSPNLRRRILPWL